MTLLQFPRESSSAEIGSYGYNMIEGRGTGAGEYAYACLHLHAAPAKEYSTVRAPSISKVN